MERKVIVQNNINILGLLGVIFVTLKLLKIIDWSWWLVTLPFWGGFALIFIIIFISLMLMWLDDIISNR